MSTRRIAFVTHEKAPAISMDDAIAASALREQNAETEAAVWSDPRVAWGEFDLVVLRSTWDYFERIDEFRSWLKQLERDRARVWNPVPTLLWNLDKRYLLELAAQGVSIIPTQRLERGTSASLADVLQREGWTSAVVKPAVSASAFRTFRTSATEAHQHDEAFQRLLSDSDVLVQPFVEEILEQGEWSFVFFDGEFSHATVKRARAGDFRTQSDFGATRARTTPSEKLLQQARAAIDARGERFLYARVDGVVVREQFQLMELELIEPSLYFDGDDMAAARFARAILARTQ